VKREVQLSLSTAACINCFSLLSQSRANEDQALFQTIKTLKGLKLSVERKFYHIHISDWLKRFRDVHEDLRNCPTIGWLSSAQTPETVADVSALVARDH
jgi:hypothetical protein